MKKWVILFTSVLVFSYLTFFAYADVETIEKTLTLATGLGANDLGDMVWDGNELLVEGSGSITVLSGDGYDRTDWLTYDNMVGWGKGTISAMWASNDTIIVSWVYYDYYEPNDSDAPHGDGVSISFDGGATWQYSGILDLFPERSNLTTPNRYTTIWDITVSNDIIWCSTTAGFLLKSDDWGQTWENILPYIPGVDESPNVQLNFENENHHGQCVDAYGDTIWVGTFQGMNLSVDGGATWKNFSYTSEDTTVALPGNFPVAVEHTVVDGKTHVWVASQKFGSYGRIGICHTTDNGATWEYAYSLSTNSKPWNISFGSLGSLVNDESSVFVATSAGLLASHDLGATWEYLDIRESDLKYWSANDGVTAVITAGDTLWATSSDGLARSQDGGSTWEIFKGLLRVKTIDTNNRDIGLSANYDYSNDDVTTYAFPNPFSPKRGSTDYRRTRIQYALENDTSVTIKIYNYSGRLIREILSNAHRSGGSDYQEDWDGCDGNGDIVPNGVYFYTIDTNKGDSARGKIMVLD